MQLYGPPPTARTVLGALNVRDFGAKGDGSNDDTSAIQRAIDAATSVGVSILFPPPSSKYVITAPLVIGDGDSDSVSSVNHVSLIGTPAAGYNETSSTGSGVPIWYLGDAAATDGMIVVNGPITGVTIEGLALDARGLIGDCLVLHHVHRSLIRAVQLANYSRRGLTQDSYPEHPTPSWGSNQNKFERVFGSTAQDNATGFLCGAAAMGAGIKDCAQNVYEHLSFLFPGHDTAGHGTTGIELRGTDYGTWLHVQASGEKGLYLHSEDTNHGFPAGHIMLDPSFSNVTADASWIGSGIALLGMPTGDGEVVPDLPGVYGFTNTGQFFGQWQNVAAARSVTLAANAVGNMTQSAGDPTVKFEIVNTNLRMASGYLNGTFHSVTLTYDGGIFTTTKDTSSKVNVYYDATAGRYVIQNKLAATNTFKIYTLPA